VHQIVRYRLYVTQPHQHSCGERRCCLPALRRITQLQRTCVRR
jgi:hypothetical protein